MEAMIVITTLLLILLGINYYYIKEVAKMKKVSINVIPSLIVSVLAVPLLAIVLPLFWLIRNIVGLLLRIQCGRSFMGFFDGLDALHVRVVPGRILILLVMELDSRHSKQNLLKRITDFVDKIIISKRREMPKFCSTLRSYLGYEYMLYQPNLDVHSCVKVLNILQGERKSKLSKDELMMLINHHSSDQFPYENKLMWDVYIGTQPISWRDNLEKTYYPVLFRFNHGVGDVVNLFKFITGVCANVDDIQHKGVYKNSKRTFTFMATAINTLITVLLFPAVICAMFVIKKDNAHSCNKMESKGLMDLRAELSSEYLFKIKNIISKYKRASFTGVLSTAISAFFEDYYTKNNQVCPEYLTAFLPIHPDAMELITLKPGSLIHNDVRFCNEYHGLHLILPISPKKDFRFKDRSLTNRLNVIMDHINFEKQSIVRKVVRELLTLLSAYIPSPILTLFPLLPNTITVSNVPGSSTISLGEDDNLKVCDYAFLVPDIQTVCYFLAITSYEQRLQISLSIRSWLWCKNNFQVIIDNIYKYIDLLEKEIENSEEK